MHADWITKEEIATPLGILFAAASMKGICFLGFNDVNIKAAHNEAEDKWKEQVAAGHLACLKGQLKEYFDGSRKEFTVPLDIQGTDFSKKVWSELMKIPYGVTKTYLQQAELLKNPLAVRAVAGANAKNRIVILIPCHRIIGSDKQLTGYVGGLERKKWLLIHEKKHSDYNEHTIFTR